MSKTFNKNIQYTFNPQITLPTSSGLTITSNSNTIGSLFTTGGNVGIGTTAPLANLEISTLNSTTLSLHASTIGNSNCFLELNRNSNIFGIDANRDYRLGNSGGQFIIQDGISTTIRTLLSIYSDLTSYIPVNILSSSGSALGAALYVNHNTLHPMNGTVTPKDAFGIRVSGNTSGVGTIGCSWIFSQNENLGLSLFLHQASTNTYLPTVGFTVNTVGNVGIGTTSPSANLEVSSPGVSVIKIQGDSANNPAFDDSRVQCQLQFRTDGNQFQYGYDFNVLNGTGNSSFMINEVRGSTGSVSTFTRMYINSSGNVGIGTTSPGVPLHVNGLSSITPNTSMYYLNYPANGATTLFVPYSNGHIMTWNQAFYQGQAVTQENNTTFNLLYPGKYIINMQTSISVVTTGTDQHYSVGFVVLSGSISAAANAAYGFCPSSGKIVQQNFNWMVIVTTPGSMRFQITPNSGLNNIVQGHVYSTNPMHTCQFTYLGV